MKTCIDCGSTFPLTNFVVKPSNKDGYEKRCRKCRSIKYNKSTPELLCKKIYLSQVTHSISRRHPLPTYSLEELTSWVFSQNTFMELYSNWQNSNYLKDLAPSVDRIDALVPYTLSNLQIMTWTANRAKSFKDKRSNTLLVNQRGVAAYKQDGTLYKKYLSMSEAMREFGGIGAQSWGISSVCNGIPVKDGRGKLYSPKTYKGFIWKWLD